MKTKWSFDKRFGFNNWTVGVWWITRRRLALDKLTIGIDLGPFEMKFTRKVDR